MFGYFNELVEARMRAMQNENVKFAVHRVFQKKK